jgi:uncharacterized protein
MFLGVFLSVWLSMNAYVAWRAASVPALVSRVPRRAVYLVVALLFASFILPRMIDGPGLALVARPLEIVGSTWLLVAFLALCCLLAVDLVTLFGFVFRRQAPTLRGWALAAAALLSAAAFVQGMRPPVVRDHDVRIAGLPRELDGTVLVFVSDFHLGTILGTDWLRDRVAQIAALKPDLVVVGGDVLEGDGPPDPAFLPTLKSLTAPLGAWAVTGNHEYHAGIERSVRILEEAGIRVLRDRWVEVRPSLVIAGVDERSGHDDGGGAAGSVDRALAGRPVGAATVLVSHSPRGVERAQAAGVGLMLAAHTHGGQVWPFGYFVQLSYGWLAGRYDVSGMPLVVSRGTGVFGPRMRLWYPAEILRIRLRSGSPA